MTAELSDGDEEVAVGDCQVDDERASDLRVDSDWLAPSDQICVGRDEGLWQWVIK